MSRRSKDRDSGIAEQPSDVDETLETIQEEEEEGDPQEIRDIIQALEEEDAQTNMTAPTYESVSGSELAAVPKFKGTAEEQEAELWCAQVARCQKQFNWSPEGTANAAKSRFEANSQAAKWLQVQEKMNQDYDTWPKLEKAIMARFGEPINEAAAANAVSNLIQMAGESVGDFYDRVCLAVDRMNFSYTPTQKAGQAYIDNMNKQILLFFGNGLTPYVKKKTVGSATPPTTAADLLKQARSVEKAEMRAKNKKSPALMEVIEKEDDDETKAKKPGSGSACENIDSEEEIEQTVSEMKKKVDDLTSSMEALKTGNWKEQAICRECGGKGHIQSECANKRRQERGRGRGRASRGRGGWRGRGRGRGFRGRGGRGNRGYGSGNYYNRGGYSNQGQNQNYYYQGQQGYQDYQNFSYGGRGRVGESNALNWSFLDEQGNE